MLKLHSCLTSTTQRQHQDEKIVSSALTLTSFACPQQFYLREHEFVSPFLSKNSDELIKTVRFYYPLLWV